VRLHYSCNSCNSQPQQNGSLTHPQDIDAPLRIAAQRKINSSWQQYADNHNIFFFSPRQKKVSTSHCMHCELLRLLFLQAHWRSRRT